MKEKTIKDIRYFESGFENSNGNPLPSHTGTIFIFGEEIVNIGQRIARKLNEYKLISGDFDHIYINYSTHLKEGVIHLSERKPEKWIKYIDFGLSPDKVNALSQTDKNGLVTNSTFQCLYRLFESDGEKTNVISKVQEEICRSGQETEIRYMTKETNEYKIVLSYQINPEGKSSSCVNILYDDKKNNRSYKKKIIDLKFYDDVYPLINSISVKDNQIILIPKKSYKAQLYNERYETPLKIDIDDITKS